MRKLLYAGCLAALAYEAVALRNATEGDTISELVWRTNRHPLCPFLAGMVAGHLFWQAR